MSHKDPTAGATTATANTPPHQDAPVSAHPMSASGTMLWCLKEGEPPETTQALVDTLQGIAETWREETMGSDAARGVAALDFIVSLAEQGRVTPLDGWRIALALLDPGDDEALVGLKAETRRWVGAVRQGFDNKNEILRACAEIQEIPSTKRHNDTSRHAGLLRQIINRYFDACRDETKVRAHHARFASALWALYHNLSALEFARAFRESRVIVEDYPELNLVLSPPPTHPVITRAWGRSPATRVT